METVNHTTDGRAESQPTIMILDNHDNAIILDVFGDPSEAALYGRIQQILDGSLRQNGEDWRDLADENADNDIDSCYRYDMGGGKHLYIYCVQGYPELAEIDEGDMRNYLMQRWQDTTEGEDPDEWLAAWGYSPNDRQIAPRDYDGPCRVWHEPQYYQGSYNAPVPHYARDDMGGIIDFPTRADAQAYIDDYRSAPSGYDGIPACNIMAHGQAGADVLTIIISEEVC